jgi:hypothetical protein
MSVHMPEPAWRKAELLVEETQQAIETQRVIVADLEKRGLDGTFARKHLAVLEETLARRIEIRNAMRLRREKKR